MASGMNCIQMMSSAMDSVLKATQDGGVVPPQHVAEAENLMKQLSIGIQQIAHMANATAPAPMDESNGTRRSRPDEPYGDGEAKERRMVGKGPLHVSARLSPPASKKRRCLGGASPALSEADSAGKARGERGLDTSRIRLASANVRTFLPWQDEASYDRNAFASLKSKTELLQMMFHDAGYGIVGIQEGRSTT
eukprot:3044035-Pyramimonas_sp.AAC.1